MGSIINLHWAQSRLWQDTQKVRFSCWGRRSGKTTYIGHRSFYRALTAPTPKASVLVLYPSLADAKLIFWNPLVASLEDGTSPWAGYVKNINRSTTTIELVGQTPNISIRGLNGNGDADHLRGLSYYNVLLDEVQNLPKGALNHVLNDVLIPGTEIHGSQIQLFGTADYEGSTFHQALDPKDIIPSTEFDHLSEEYFQSLREILPEEEYNREVLCHFGAVTGRVFSSFNGETSTRGDNWRQMATPVVGLDHGSVHPAVVTLHYTTNPLTIEISHAWTNPTSEGIPIDEVIPYIGQFSPMRIYSPNDRPDITKQLKRIFPSKVKNTCRRKHNPKARVTIANRLFHQGRLTISPDAPLAAREFASLRWKDSSVGSVIGDDHIVDAALYAVSELYTMFEKS